MYSKRPKFVSLLLLLLLLSLFLLFHWRFQARTGDFTAIPRRIENSNHSNHRDIVAALPCSKCCRTVPFTEWLHLSWIWLMLNQTQTRNTSSACWESVDWSFARVEHGDQVSRTRNSDHAARKCDMFVYSIVHNKIAWLSNMADTHLF